MSSADKRIENNIKLYQPTSNHISEVVKWCFIFGYGATIVCGIAEERSEGIFLREVQIQCFESRGSGPVLWIRTGFNADPDPAFYLHADPDPVFHLNADPDPGIQTNAVPCGSGF